MASKQPLIRIDTAALSKLKQDTAQFDKTIIRDLKVAVKRVAQRGVDAEKAALEKSPPSGGRDHVGSREGIIRGIRVSFSFAARSASAKIVTSPRFIPPAQVGDTSFNRNVFMFAYNKQRFRHPVFGNKGTWVSQPANPFFREAIVPALDQTAIREIEAALDAAVRAYTK